MIAMYISELILYLIRLYFQYSIDTKVNYQKYTN